MRTQMPFKRLVGLAIDKADDGVARCKAFANTDGWNKFRCGDRLLRRRIDLGKRCVRRLYESSQVLARHRVVGNVRAQQINSQCGEILLFGLGHGPGSGLDSGTFDVKSNDVPGTPVTSWVWNLL